MVKHGVNEVAFEMLLEKRVRAIGIGLLCRISMQTRVELSA